MGAREGLRLFSALDLHSGAWLRLGRGKFTWSGSSLPYSTVGLGRVDLLLHTMLLLTLLKCSPVEAFTFRPVEPSCQHLHAVP